MEPVTPTLFGVSYYLWGAACLILAILYVWVSPRPRGGSGSLRTLVLRWFHTLVWVLLAAACFIRAAQPLAGTGLPNRLALLALILYVIFMGAFLMDRSQARRTQR